MMSRLSVMCLVGWALLSGGSVRAQSELLAVIDRSNPATAELNADQLGLLAQTARGEAARLLAGKGYTILSEENTISILRDMGVELASCEGECEVEIARKLQADWLLSSKVVRFGQGWNLQVNLFQASSGSLMGSERGRAELPEELVEHVARCSSRLSQGLMAQFARGNEALPDTTADWSSPFGPVGTSDHARTPLELPPFYDAVPVDTGAVRNPGPVAGMEFITLSGGTFLMGSPDSERGRKLDEVQHPVTLSPFSLMSTEVTWAQWNWVTGDPLPRKARPEHPVTGVEWTKAQQFVERLNVLDPAHTYRLPTEAEWEYACRAGGSGAWSTGDDPAALDSLAWHKGNSGGKVQPVATRAPNTWGFHDLHGNVLELVQDRFQAYAKGAQRDPVVNSANARVSRVYRGGSCQDEPVHLRCARRRPLADQDVSGFRLARQP